MHILLWVLKILLALWYVTGGVYMVNHYEELANAWALDTLSQPIWIILGTLQVVFALGLVLPGILKALPERLSFISAVGLIVISLLGLALYSAYEGFPGILWGIIPAILAAYVAYGKWPAKLV